MDFRRLTDEAKRLMALVDNYDPESSDPDPRANFPNYPGPGVRRVRRLVFFVPRAALAARLDVLASAVVPF